MPTSGGHTRSVLAGRQWSNGGESDEKICPGASVVGCSSWRPRSQPIRQTIKYLALEALNVGIVYRPDGKRVYASAGGNNKIRVYDVAADGTLSEARASDSTTSAASSSARRTRSAPTRWGKRCSRPPTAWASTAGLRASRTAAGRSRASCNNLCDTAPDPGEYAARNAADIAGCSTLSMRFATRVIAFGKPVAYVHGDSHYFRIDKPFLDAQGRRLESGSSQAQGRRCQYDGRARRDGSNPAYAWCGSDVSSAALAP
jgi:hypothetical protein